MKTSGLLARGRALTWLVVFMALCGPLVAWAQQGGGNNPNNNYANFTPTQQDFSINHLLKNTFGEVTGGVLGTGTTGGMADVVGTAMLYFNSAVLFFGTIILAYVTLFGVMNTANDGQALGKKWSTTYTPLRIAASAASLIPTTSGFSIIQLIVLKIVVWGVGIADTTWTNVVAASLTRTLPNSFVAVDGDQNAVRKIASDMLLAKVCAHTLNQTLGLITDGRTNITAVRYDMLTTNGPYEIQRVLFNFEDTAIPPAADKKPLCGSLAFQFKQPRISNQFGSVFTSSGSPQRSFQADEAIFGASQTQAIANAMALNFGNAAYTAMDARLEALKTQIVTPGAPVNAALFQEAINDYLRTLRTGYSTTVDQLNSSNPYIHQFMQTTTQRGWVSAGMFHRRISQIQSALRDAYRIYPESQPPSWNLVYDTGPRLDPGFLTAFGVAQKRAADAIAAAQTAATAGAGNQVQEGMPSLNLTDAASDPTHMWEQWVKGIGQRIIAKTIDFLMVPDNGGWVDPVIQVKGLGDYMMVAGETMIAAKALATVAVHWSNAGASIFTGNVVGQVTGANEVKNAVRSALLGTIEELWNVVAPSAYGLLYTGYFMSIFLPMVPFMIFALAVIGWLIAVIESVIAAALWMVMHMTPESNDSFIGSQQQGYLLLLSVFFKPILIILGLVFSIIVLRPVMDFINIGFIGSMTSIQNDSVTGIGSIFGYLLVYAFITLATFSFIFAMPQDMGDRVLKWISAGIGGLGEKDAMGRIESGGSAMARSATGAAAARSKGADDRLAKAIKQRKLKQSGNNRREEPANDT